MTEPASLYQGPEDYLQTMITALRDADSAITDFNEGSVARTIFESFAVALSEQSLVLDQTQDNFYLATATGDALDLKAADYQVTRKGAFQASGEIRISRPAVGAAVTIPAGFGALQAAPAPGQPPVQFLTTEDAVFAGSDLQKDVAAIAVLGGADGNIADLTQLYPTNPVLGFSTESGFAAQGAFTGGVDEETDDKLRDRVVTTVQGRVIGTEAAYLAAALAVVGVDSAAVLKAGDTRSNLTVVPAGSVEVYYEGSAGLLAAVESAVDAAAEINASSTAFTATARRCYAALTVYVLAGTDTTGLTTTITDTIRDTVNANGVGVIARYSDAIRAIDALPQIISVAVPFADFRRFSDGGGTDADIDPGVDQYCDLAAADVSIAITEI